MNINENIEEIRKNFPVTKNLVYLDHAAVAPVHIGSKSALEEYTEHFLNKGIRDYIYWYEKTEKIREDFAKFTGADSSEIAFIKNTSSGISVFANGIKFEKNDNIIIPNIEFPSNIYPWLNIEKRNLENKDVKVKFLTCSDGTIDLDKLAEAIDEKTRVVSLSWVQFSSGYKVDLAKVSELIKQKSRLFGRKIYFCVDAIQGVGALELDVSKTEIDFFAADAHKWFLAAEGIGFLYCTKNIIDEIYPSTVGWKSVTNPLDFSNIHFDLEKSARKFEEGSLNIAGISTLGASLELFNRYGIKNIENKILNLSKFACELLISKNIDVFTKNEDFCRSGIITFKTKNIEDDFKKLINNNFQLSLRGGLLRISPHFYNTHEEIERLVKFL